MEFVGAYETSKGKYVNEEERRTLCAVVAFYCWFPVQCSIAVLCRLPLVFFVGFALFGSSAGVSTLVL